MKNEGGEQSKSSMFCKKSGMHRIYEYFYEVNLKNHKVISEMPNKCVSLVFLSFFSVLLFSCANELKYDDKDPKIYKLQERASKIDSRAKEHPEINFVFGTDKKPADTQFAVVDTRVKPRGKLVIWLMGNNKGLFDRLASYGMHTIGVHYARGWFSKLHNKNDADTEHIGKIRLEAATGEDFSTFVNIPKPDGMMERSYQFVKWLAKTNPQGKWDYFLTKDGKGLRWEDVIVTGASHGSTTAARFAKHVKVSRVVMFSGPRDQTQTWQSLPSATPENRFFGFTHVLDSGWPAHYDRSWKMLGLEKFGSIVDVDKAKPPYSHSRQLTTNADVKKDRKKAHGASTPGGASPKDKNGKYLYEPVWKYLFTEPVK